MHINWSDPSQIAALIAIGLAILAAYRWINRMIIEPLAAVRHFTTQNGNKDENKENPTLRDELHDIKTELVRQGKVQESQGVLQSEQTTEQKEQRQMLEQHLSWSSEETGRLWKAIGKKADV